MGGRMSVVDSALKRSGESARQEAATGRGWYAVAARSGLVAKGISFGLVGVLAIELALGNGGKATGREGALAQLSRHSFGRIVLIALAAGFVVFGLIGVFLVKAALDYKPSDAIGIDGALQKLAHASYGPFLLGLTAAGLVAYGLYCLVDARLRDVSANA